MAAYSQNNKRIAKNTLLLYVRMLMMMAVSLYTSRIVLDALGVVDYGIYNVVGGVVTLFSFLNGTMSAATQRFLSYAIGKGDEKLLQDTFSQTLVVHVLIALAIIFLAEALGYKFVVGGLTIPEQRLSSAVWVFHFSLLSLAFTIVQMPYTAMIIAQERMSAFAYFSIIEALMKLGVAFSLQWLAVDKLRLYGLLLCAVSVSTMLLYSFYCRFRFKAKSRWIWNSVLLKNLLGFAGWNLSAHIALVARTQGVNILLNLFFGPALNAARGIAVQVSGALSSFVNNFQLAVGPQLVKSYAQGDMDGMRQLAYSSTKMSFLLVSMLVLPVYLECGTVLALWLKDVPGYALLFTRLVLVSMLVDALSGTLGYSAIATGNIKGYQLSLSSLFLLNPLLVYLLFKFGFQPEVAYWVEIVFNMMALCDRLLFLRHLIGLSVRRYLKSVFVPCVLLLLMSVFVLYSIRQAMETSLLRLLAIVLSSIVSVTGLGYLIVLDKSERLHVNNLVKRILYK